MSPVHGLYLLALSATGAICIDGYGAVYVSLMFECLNRRCRRMVLIIVFLDDALRVLLLVGVY